jgi:hypothetical protein
MVVVQVRDQDPVQVAGDRWLGSGGVAVDDPQQPGTEHRVGEEP